jgi:hypothetical protein
MLQALEQRLCPHRARQGLLERSVILKHAMRNALTPVITLGALEFGTLLSGAVLTEQIFTIPGFGKLIIDAVFNRDYAVVQGVVLVTRRPTSRSTSGRRALRAGQSAAEGVMADVPYDSALIARARRRDVESPMRARAAPAQAPQGRVVGLVVIALFVCSRCSRR